VANDRAVYGYMSGINRDGTKYAGLLGRARRDFKRDQDNLNVGGILHSRFIGEDEGYILLNEYDQQPHVGNYGFVYVYHPNVIRMDTRTGNYRSILQNPGKVVGWGTDKDGVVKVGVEYDKGYSTAIYRETADAPWHKLEGLVNIKRTMGLLGMSADGNTLYVTTPTPARTWGVYAYDLKKQKLGEMLVGHDSYDLLRNGISVDGHPIERMVFAPVTHELLGIQYFTDLPKVVWFDPTLASVQEALDQGLPNRTNSIVDMSDDRKKLVVLSWSAKDPGTYYIFDLDKKQLKQLFATEPWIKPDQMADVYPISYKSRDGLIIHGYLTVPKGQEPKNLPLVVFPHGGPFGRDSWGYRKDQQFLASRGYAVLQMNYRGSPGFGEDFFVKGQRHIGRELQDDITDGTRWAIAQGIADPKRIAIMGWSFGGYSALMGTIREPDLYRCAIDLAGVTDWVAILKYQKSVTEGFGDETNAEMIGDPIKDAADLADISPVNHVDKIRVPLLLVYSKDDTTVPYEQARLFRSALDKAKKPYELVTEVNEGHGFYTYDHRLDLYKKVDQFLSANMK
jgi:dipeptidyl aminopeptidase/acylaminoacyl peptidase